MKMTILVIFFSALIASCSKMSCQSSALKAPDYSGITVKSSVITDLHEGQGIPVGPDQRVTLHLEGWIYEPAKPLNRGPAFEMTSPDHPLTFVVGQKEVFQGLDQGVVGMRPGGKRRLIIPPELGYPKNGHPKVPDGAILLIEVVLLK